MLRSRISKISAMTFNFDLARNFFLKSLHPFTHRQYMYKLIGLRADTGPQKDFSLRTFMNLTFYLLIVITRSVQTFYPQAICVWSLSQIGPRGWGWQREIIPWTSNVGLMEEWTDRLITIKRTCKSRT